MDNLYSTGLTICVTANQNKSHIQMTEYRITVLLKYNLET